jgi:isopentenyl diphosphate isomerase/L-lactate dehydrogenase-like FMN-dependent dehydrogenase
VAQFGSALVGGHRINPLLWREKTLAFVQRVEAAGYKAIMVTVDGAVGGLRERGARADFKFPADVMWANLGASLTLTLTLLG